MKIEVHVHKACNDGDDWDELGERVASIALAVTQLKGDVMARFQDVDDALTRIDVATSALAEDVTAVVAMEALQLAEIQALKDQIAAGSPVTQEQLDQLATRSQSAATALEGAAAALDTIGTNGEDPLPDEGGEGGEGGEPGTGGEGGESPVSEGEVSAARDLSTARPAGASRKGGLRS